MEERREVCESDHGRNSAGQDRITWSLSVMELSMGLYLAESTEKLELRECPKQFLKPDAHCAPNQLGLYSCWSQDSLGLNLAGSDSGSSARHNSWVYTLTLDLGGNS